MNETAAAVMEAELERSVEQLRAFGASLQEAQRVAFATQQYGAQKRAAAHAAREAEQVREAEAAEALRRAHIDEEEATCREAAAVQLAAEAKAWVELEYELRAVRREGLVSRAVAEGREDEEREQTEEMEEMMEDEEAGMIEGRLTLSAPTHSAAPVPAKPLDAVVQLSHRLFGGAPPRSPTPSETLIRTWRRSDGKGSNSSGGGSSRRGHSKGAPRQVSLLA